jgi:hypothetical protein
MKTAKEYYDNFYHLDAQRELNNEEIEDIECMEGFAQQFTPTNTNKVTDKGNELEFALNNYVKEKHTQEECIGFIDGFNKGLSLSTQEKQEERKIKVLREQIIVFLMDVDEVYGMHIRAEAEKCVDEYLQSKGCKLPFISYNPNKSDAIDFNEWLYGNDWVRVNKKEVEFEKRLGGYRNGKVQNTATAQELYELFVTQL